MNFSGTEEAIKYGKALIDYSSKDRSSIQNYGVDTTFDLGDYYVTILTMRNVFMEENPVWPFCFFIHKSRQESRFSEFLFFINNAFDLNKDENAPFTIDRDASLKSAAHYHKMNVVYCTNHIIRDCKRWVSQKTSSHVTKSDGKIFIEFIKKLINAEEEDTFLTISDELIEKFSHNEYIINYYENSLKNDIYKYAARFRVKRFKIFKDCNATNNSNESINSVLKGYLDREKTPIDLIIIKFFHLQNFYINEFYRGSLDFPLGKYRKNLKTHPKRFFVKIENFLSYDDILKSIITPETRILPRIKNSERPAIVEIARTLLNCKKVKLEKGYFSVEAYSTKNIYRVEIYPKPKCTCSTKGLCSHILACQIKLGKYSDEDVTEMNLSQLVDSQDTKKYKSGRKQFSQSDKKSKFEALFKKPELASNDKAEIKINLSDLTKNIDFGNDDSDSELIVDYVKNQENCGKIFYEKIIETQNNFITRPIKIKRNIKKTIHPDNNIYPWHNVKITKEKFTGQFETLEGENFLCTELIDKAIHSIIAEYNNGDFFGYLSSYANDNILFNQIELLFQKIFFNSLLNKQVIFILIHSDIMKYPVSSHFYLGIISLVTKKIFILDSLSNSKKNSDYCISFYSLINIAKIIYNSYQLLNFDLTEWQFIISNDSSQQEDGYSCGYQVISNIASVLSIGCQINNLNKDDILSLKYWIRNVIRKNEKSEIVKMVPPESYPEFDHIEINSINIICKNTGDEIQSLAKIAIKSSLNQNCDFIDCKLKDDLKFICIKCRNFFHNCHDMFENDFNDYYKICKVCYENELNSI